MMNTEPENRDSVLSMKLNKIKITANSVPFVANPTQLLSWLSHILPKMSLEYLDKKFYESLS